METWLESWDDSIPDMPYDDFGLTEFANEQKRWMKETLSNDEASTDAELIAYFIDGGIPREIAEKQVAMRNDYLRGLELDFYLKP